MVQIYIILVGLTIASFIGSLSYRAPGNISIIRPRSFCIYCKKTIKPYDLIPFLSYIILGGRCRFCKNKIPLKYFVIEIIIPLIYIGIYIKSGPGYEFFLLCYLITVLVYLSLVDFDTGALSIYDIFSVYIGGFCLLLLSLMGKLRHPPSYFLYGALSASVLISLSFLIIFLVKRKVPMGAGDLLVIPGASLYFGVFEVIRVLIFSSLFGIFVGLTLIFTSIVEKSSKFPMIPYITAGVVIEILFF